MTKREIEGDMRVPLPPHKGSLGCSTVSILTDPDGDRSTTTYVSGDVRMAIHGCVETLLTLSKLLKEAAGDGYNDIAMQNWRRALILLLFEAILGDLDEEEERLDKEIEEKMKENPFWPPIFDAMK